jgi:hypothetical protein
MFHKIGGEMKFIKKLFLSILALIVFGAFFTQSAMATGGIQITPITYNFNIEPGQSKEAKVTVINRSKDELFFNMESEIFNKVSEDGAPTFSDTAHQAGVTTLVDWITFKDKEGSVKPNEYKQINFNISVPKGAEPGGHYAAVFAKAVKKDTKGQTQLGVASRVGTLVLVSVPGQVKKSANISEFNTPKFIWKGPLDFVMRVRNEGSVHFDSTANIQIKPILGSATNIKMGTHTILPNSIRKFEGKWNKRFPFGYYNLTATATDGNGNPMTTTHTLWAIPLEIVIPSLVALIILIVIIKYVKKHVRFVE